MKNKHKSAETVDESLAIDIWNAGVSGAGAEKIVRDSICLGDSLSIAGETFDLPRLKKIIVVGFGKCSGGMAAGFESAVQDLQGIELSGLVILPQGQTASTVHVRTTVGRPRANNFPTATVVEQTQRLKDIICGAGEDTLIVAMVSGGGSALLESPLVPLEELVAVSRSLSGRGAPIEALNTVRRALSGIKAGGLAWHVLEHSRASMVGLIISDVVGDSLETVASGPTVISATSTQQQRSAARKVMLEFELQDKHHAVYRWLGEETKSLPPLDSSARITNCLLANNATAVNAAQTRAAELNFSSNWVDGAAAIEIDVNRDVNEVARSWVELASVVLGASGSGSQDAKPLGDQAIAIVAGGEPTVVLCESPGRGGRNLQLAALVLQKLSQGWKEQNVHIAFVSGGSDGEDGSASVAGGSFDSKLLGKVFRSTNLQAALQEAIVANDCGTFFQRHGGQLLPPSVSTNVSDLQVMLIGPRNPN